MKLNTFEKVLIAIISVLLTLTFFFGIIRNKSTLTDIDNSLYSIGSIVKNTFIKKPYESFVSFVENFTTYQNIRHENDLLRKDIETLNEYKSELMDAKRQITELKELLDLKTTLVDYKLIEASVIGRDLSTWTNIIEIDVGLTDGIDNNYAVISPKGLLGRIYKIYDNYSLVKLITCEDSMNKVSVQIQINAETTVDGYLETYDAEKGYFVIKLFSTGQTVTTGMTVMTSGLGKVFPSGLLVGTVSEVSELNNAVGMNVYVTPSADFNNFNYVSVVKMD